MRCLWAGGLGMFLAWSVAAAAAEPLGVTLGRPQALNDADAGVQQTGFLRQPGVFPGLARPQIIEGPIVTEPAVPTPKPVVPTAPHVERRSEFAADTEEAPPADDAPPAGGAKAAPPVESAPMPRPLAPPSGPDVTVGPAEVVDGDGSFDFVDGRRFLSQWYGGAEYLLWWIRGSGTPPLATAGAPAGILGAPGTTVLFGGSAATTQHVMSGARFTLGRYFGLEQNIGLENTFLFLGERSVRFGASTDNHAVLARPFAVPSAGVEAPLVLAAPGGIFIDAPSKLWGDELNVRWNLDRGEEFKLDLLTGFRYLQLDEGLHITSVSGAGTAGHTVIVDNFDTRNQFFGAQIGLDAEWRFFPRWALDFWAKVALGGTRRESTINGATSGAGGGTPGGLLAAASNSGKSDEGRFGFVPEFGLNVNWYLTDNLQLHVGYTFIYWSSVFRPGDQVDRAVDVGRPVVLNKGTGFFAQGVNLGLEYKY